MNQSQIIEKVKEAKEYLDIDLYPGNLFGAITKNKSYIDKLNLFLVKQDTGKTSGFIGYVEEVPIICINYKRSIGHQNFTLAHELGHYFLHKGQAMTDTDKEIHGNDVEEIENEANIFAKELLYPENLAKEDIQIIKKKNLFSFEESKYDELGDYINSLCEKYYISFDFAINRLIEIYKYVYKVRYVDYNKIRKFKNYLKPYYKRYTDYMYNTNCDHEFYRPYNPLTSIINSYVDILVKNEKISYQTGQAIVKRSKKLEG
ncbi:Metallopeptidase immA [[Clostridium] sordellii]|uniref:ImmA/IrrE family metallo-endopeptidase n=1 Tax=Paraclostridium sordellii TaxID=1505 RepID=UPI0005E5F774|nr:ImmA/IrrE family metallo-endopeptidase [Paeniclostridium sordellii]CEP97584.1 Metallopeptidase immA [[Clostridium] sordellii] [Paeniclostridium sordellii]